MSGASRKVALYLATPPGRGLGGAAPPLWAPSSCDFLSVRAPLDNRAITRLGGGPHGRPHKLRPELGTGKGHRRAGLLAPVAPPYHSFLPLTHCLECGSLPPSVRTLAVSKVLVSTSCSSLHSTFDENENQPRSVC